MKILQNQVWKRAEEYLRVVSVDRQEVRFKAMFDLLSGVGEHRHVSKKEFCRLVKDATLLTPEEARASWLASASQEAELPPVSSPE